MLTDNLATLRALVFDGDRLGIATYHAPSPTPNEVLVRPFLMGICSTDLELMRGYKNFRGMLGHEFVGEVVAGDAQWLGKRVVGEINIGCGNCGFCQKGIKEHCLYRRTLGITGTYDGVFGDCFRMPIANLHEVPTNITNEQAVFTEPLAAACQILEQTHIHPHDTVYIIGLGKLGMLVAQVLKTTRANVMGIVRHPRQMEMLNQWGIAAHPLEHFHAKSADVVIDCTAHEKGFAAAVELVKARGRIILKSTYSGLPLADLTRLVVDEIQVIGSRCGPFEVALRMLAEGTVATAPLIEGIYPLDEAEMAFQHAQQPGVFKVLMHP